MNKCLQRCLLLLPIFLGSSCSVDKMLDESRTELTRTYDELPPFETLPVRVLSWQQAWATVEKNNLDMQQAVQSVKDAKKKQDSVFRNLIPQVNMGYYYSMALFGNDEEIRYQHHLQHTGTHQPAHRILHGGARHLQS